MVLTVFSFIKTTKYPASLLYLLMTLGPALLALAWFERLGPSHARNVVVRLGRVPLFFYLLQWPLAAPRRCARQPGRRQGRVGILREPAVSLNGEACRRGV